ncbi:hypothetical protein [Photobacterium nomapromontoriensis]|uniref:hypothetical protein n=1 Tax=Photobacterium nomapromontoriensis TaxID=2910237 RepID=UPI003D12C461
MKNLVLFLLVLLVAGCVGDGEMMRYEITDITDVTYTTDGKGLTLSYTLPLETLYYSPGVDVSDSADGTLLIIRKCSINNKCEVDIQSEHAEASREVLVLDTQEDPSRIYVNQIQPSNSLAALTKK